MEAEINSYCTDSTKHISFSDLVPFKLGGQQLKLLPLLRLHNLWVNIDRGGKKNL